LPALEYFFFRVMRLLRKLPVNVFSIGSPAKFFLDYFKDFDKVQAVKDIFGQETTQVLSKLRVEFTWLGGDMYVDGSDGHLVVNKSYLNTGDKTDIYLDLVHELIHVKQFMDGRELFDPKYEYVDRPTEIEAYRYTVQEARRIGLSEERICHYLKTEWMTEADLKRLMKYVNVKFS
jgi:hypothetical protein